MIQCDSTCKYIGKNANKNPRDVTIWKYLFTAKLLYMFRVSQHPSSGVLKLYPQPPVQVIILVQLLPFNVVWSGLRSDQTTLHSVASVGFLFTLNYDVRNHELKISERTFIRTAVLMSMFWAKPDDGSVSAVCVTYWKKMRTHKGCVMTEWWQFMLNDRGIFYRWLMMFGVAIYGSILLCVLLSSRIDVLDVDLW